MGGLHPYLSLGPPEPRWLGSGLPDGERWQSLGHPKPDCPQQGHLAPPVLGQALGSWLPSLPSGCIARAMMVSSPCTRTLICGPGWHLPWPPPQPPDLVPAGGPQCCVCLQKLLGWLRMYPGRASPSCPPTHRHLPCHVVSNFLSGQGQRQPRSLAGHGGEWGKSCPFSASTPYASPSGCGSWAHLAPGLPATQRAVGTAVAPLAADSVPLEERGHWAPPSSKCPPTPYVPPPPSA